jgi:hypothetical protein
MTSVADPGAVVAGNLQLSRRHDNLSFSAENIQLSRRHDDLSFSAHSVVGHQAFRRLSREGSEDCQNAHADNLRVTHTLHNYLRSFSSRRLSRAGFSSLRREKHGFEIGSPEDPISLSTCGLNPDPSQSIARGQELPAKARQS